MRVPAQWSRPQPDQEPGALGQQQLPLEQGGWLAGGRQSCKPVWLEQAGVKEAHGAFLEPLGQCAQLCARGG